MCTRFRAPHPRSIQEIHGISLGDNQAYNPNVASTETAVIIRNAAAKAPAFELAKFGLIPPWASNGKTAISMVNSRRKTIREKPAFKKAYQKQRCVIPLDGFYEWREEQGKKQPYYFTRKSGKLLYFAGIWERATINNEETYSFSILTGEPNALVAPFPDRMPIITDDIDRWLDTTQDPLDDLSEVPSAEYDVRPMNQAMNKPSVKDIDLIENGPHGTLL
jgi:putative SOS response-associated peptidase YedK